MGNWELSNSIPNPDSTLYDGVYQSIHTGQNGALDKMVIEFEKSPNFELYIRSNAESSYDYVIAGKLDDTQPTESNYQASTRGNQNSGTDLSNYIKVNYPNDGKKHTITVIYRKDGSGNTGDDRGYVFWKPQYNQL